MQTPSSETPDAPRRGLPPWALIGIAAAVIGIIFTIAITRNAGDFVASLLACGMPFALFTTLLAFIATAGKRSRRLCGFCGYDRTGLARETLCPECGREYTPNAPGYQPVGKRALPAWIWLPALLPIPAMLLFRFAGTYSGQYIVGCLVALGAILLAAGVQAWRQAR